MIKVLLHHEESQSVFWSRKSSWEPLTALGHQVGPLFDNTLLMANDSVRLQFQWTVLINSWGALFCWIVPVCNHFSKSSSHPYSLYATFKREHGLKSMSPECFKFLQCTHVTATNYLMTMWLPLFLNYFIVYFNRTVTSRGKNLTHQAERKEAEKEDIIISPSSVPLNLPILILTKKCKMVLRIHQIPLEPHS
jgi:hypothetical protein